ncbi:hypothetical protein AB0I60_19070 [Actinosynnema sp. NPDC050436]|uniref:hypothetical protein n=1 Tax=Actinosynnema sp. NPDC050436 TaxID=3155659 RepID=UPI0033CC26DD
MRKNNGQEAILTAEHCGTDWDWNTPDGDRLVGRSEGGRADLDTTVLTGPGYGSAICVGPWDAETTSARPVVGAGNPGSPPVRGRGPPRCA